MQLFYLLLEIYQVKIYTDTKQQAYDKQSQVRVLLCITATKAAVYPVVYSSLKLIEASFCKIT